MSQPIEQANPYSAPKAKVDDAGTSGAPPSLWNPNAAANWSLIFTPAFGAYLHVLNWRALGEPERAAAARLWFIVSLVMLVVYVLLGIFVVQERAADGAARGLAFIFLLIWYFSSARRQANYVKEKWGGDYPRKGWWKPLLIGVGAIVGYFVLALLIGVGIGLMQRAV
ncbi:MAG: hypothetical protein OEO84_11045 [Betaproteobacteria bacterium]|nr:hypothetical protein [Betaproteobacteria bacterium]